jgi:hypothetical protein
MILGGAVLLVWMAAAATAKPQPPGRGLRAEPATQRADRAHLEELARKNAGWWGVRGLVATARCSPFPRPYAYLFVLLVITGGGQLVLFPLTWYVARSSAIAERLRPQIGALKEKYPDRKQREREEWKLYRAHGASPFAGCLLMHPTMVLVLLSWAALARYAPQMVLDGARFLWVHDVTRPDLTLALVTALAGLAVFARRAVATWWPKDETEEGSLKSDSRGSPVARMLVAGALFVAVLWHCHFPVYLLLWGWLWVGFGLAANWIARRAAARSEK